ncbi:hypothetical protein ACFIOY_40265 [Bradyrhizobium sp. TZ2]
MRGLATRSFNELIYPRGLRQQMLSGRPTPDLSNKQSDTHVCEIKNEDGIAQILRCLDLQTFNTRHQRGEVHQNVNWPLARAVWSGFPLVRPMKF